MKVPIPESYWVEAERFLAGEYPGAPTDADAVPKLAAFREGGVTSFIDLTEEIEGLRPYEGWLPQGVRVRRSPIPDGACPSWKQMRETLDLVDDELARGEVVYLHCWGGHGRTGTVVGCWLVRHGLNGPEALRRLVELRRDTPDARLWPSPETEEQRQMVLGWDEESA